MANTSEAAEQEEEQEEQQKEELIEDEIEEYVPPKQAKRVYHTKANLPIEELWEDDNLPSNDFICTKEYSNINRIADCDHLMDENWNKWKERMKCVGIGNPRPWSEAGY